MQSGFRSLVASSGVLLEIFFAATAIFFAPRADSDDTADARIRVLAYGADEVYRLKGYVGYQIDLEFEPGETFVGLGTGDLDSLTFAAQDNHLILRCSSSEHGGTSQFASRLIGEREVIRWQTSRASDRERWFASRGSRRSTSVSRQHVTEAAVLPSELEQLPDLCGYLKTAAFPAWLQVRFDRGC